MFLGAIPKKIEAVLDDLVKPGYKMPMTRGKMPPMAEISVTLFGALRDTHPH